MRVFKKFIIIGFGVLAFYVFFVCLCFTNISYAKFYQCSDANDLDTCQEVGSCNLNDDDCFEASVDCSSGDQEQCLKDMGKKYKEQSTQGFVFPNTGLDQIPNEILATAGGIIFGIAVLKIIIGGVMYTTAAGNPNQISEAKSHIQYALIGVALITGMGIILFLIGA